jgi:hypothetical protein
MPVVVADFARRSIEPSYRCSFAELESAVKGSGGAAK